MDEKTGVYNVSVNPSRITYYYEAIIRRGNWKPRTESLQNLTDNSHKGRLSPSAIRKVIRAIDYLLYISKPKSLPNTHHGRGYKFRLNFITLTLPSHQIHTDNEITRLCLQPFLNSLRQKWKCTHYIWRAEKQKNGSIHYHIVTGKFIPWSELRDVWNRHLETLGYISRYRTNMSKYHGGKFRFNPSLSGRWPIKAQRAAYARGVATDWQSPNSTDIHSIRKIQNIQAYFVKYMTKQAELKAEKNKADSNKTRFVIGKFIPWDESRDGLNKQANVVTCRLWGCSYSLSNLTGAQAYACRDIEADLDKIEASGKIRTYSGDFFTIIFVTVEDLERLQCHHLLALWRSYLFKSFPALHPRLADHIAA